MRLEYLVDTDWVIHYLTGQSHIIVRLDALKEAGLAVSHISLAELYEGIYSSTDPDANERALGDFLAGVTVLGIDVGICQHFGRERARLRRAGRLIGDFDLLLASTCLRHNLTLLTGNLRHFEAVEGLRIGS